MSSTKPTPEPGNVYIRFQLKEFTMPPIKDALIIGKNAVIGSEALLRALKLLHASTFEHIQVDGDDIIEDMLFRTSILRKVPKETLVDLVLTRVKPYMSADEVVHLDIYTELTLEEQL